MQYHASGAMLGVTYYREAVLRSCFETYTHAPNLTTGTCVLHLETAVYVAFLKGSTGDTLFRGIRLLLNFRSEIEWWFKNASVAVQTNSRYTKEN